MPRAKKISTISKVSRKSKVSKSKLTATKSKSILSELSAEVYDTNGRRQGSFNLPNEFFGQKVNESLLTQALHVYFENQSKHTASTKTRSETRGGGAKPWRQKGTGRARAGSKRSPLWVGGGITHGPKYRDTHLNFPKKMKHKALISALSSKANSNSVKVITNIEKIEPKTKVIANLLKKLNLKGSNLFVVSDKNPSVKLAARNLQRTSVDTSVNLNALEIIQNKNIFFSKEAIGKLS